MSFSLSDLLNPAPAGEAAEQNARKNSLPPLQVPQSPHTYGTTPYGDNTNETPSMTRDAAHALASLSSSTAPPPQPWGAIHPSASDQSRPSSDARRMSIFSEAAMPLEPGSLAQKMSSPFEPFHPTSRSPETSRMSEGHASAATLRKMSSPTLEQYHMASRSPEHRRASVAQAFNPGFTLPPIQSMSSPTLINQQGFSKATDTSQSISTYGQNDPTTTQILQPMLEQEADQVPDQIQPTSEERRSSLAAVKTESSQVREAIPAFVPVASLKQEHSAHTHSPLREASVPVPSTEDMPTPVTSSRKRPAPKSAAKKGMANTVKKGPPSKKRKLDADGSKTLNRSTTPSSQKAKPKKILAKKAPSNSATPLNSSPAPRSVRANSSPPRSSPSVDDDAAYSGEEEEEDEEDQGTPDPDADLYCICRRPDTGTFMIGCDGGCDDWFHGKCVGIEERNKNLIDRYICPECQKKERGHTTWKRMCRRAGCRVAARVGGKKNKGEGASKYCSEECGLAYFREVIAKTRGAEDGSTRKSGKKRSGAGPDLSKNLDDDIGSRGGALSAGELKALVNAAPGFDDFKRLGDGVLSPPATPKPASSKASFANGELPPESDTLNDVEIERVSRISESKDATRVRHGLLKDRVKFITMLKQAAARIAEEKDMKPKEMCGYDSRIAWSEERFARWRSSRTGSDALKAGTMEPASSTNTEVDGEGATNGASDEDDDPSMVCTKRKCARHYDWAKLSLDDTRFEIGENSEVMRSLDREERNIRERAGLRARELRAGDVGGSVELHDPNQNAVEDEAILEASADSMDVEAGGAAPEIGQEAVMATAGNALKVPLHGKPFVKDSGAIIEVDQAPTPAVERSTPEDAEMVDATA